MTTTSQTFNALAAALLEGAKAATSRQERLRWARAAHAQADALAKTNKRFDRARFLASCGWRDNP